MLNKIIKWLYIALLAGFGLSMFGFGLTFIAQSMRSQAVENVSTAMMLLGVRTIAVTILPVSYWIAWKTIVGFKNNPYALVSRRDVAAVKPQDKAATRIWNLFMVVLAVGFALAMTYVIGNFLIFAYWKK